MHQAVSLRPQQRWVLIQPGCFHLLQHGARVGDVPTAIVQRVLARCWRVTVRGVDYVKPEVCFDDGMATAARLLRNTLG